LKEATATFIGVSGSQKVGLRNQKKKKTARFVERGILSVIALELARVWPKPN